MTTPPTMSIPQSAPPSFAANESFIEQQEHLFRLLRYPYPTEPGAEERTFYFRAASTHDLPPLRAMVEWAIEKWWNSPLSPCEDVDVKMTLLPETLCLDEVRYLFSLLDDDLATETLSLGCPGIRQFIPLEKLGIKVPRMGAMHNASESLNRHLLSLAAQSQRASTADERLWSHLVKDSAD